MKSKTFATYQQELGELILLAEEASDRDRLANWCQRAYAWLSEILLAYPQLSGTRDLQFFAPIAEAAWKRALLLYPHEVTDKLYPYTQPPTNAFVAEMVLQNLGCLGELGQAAAGDGTAQLAAKSQSREPAEPRKLLIGWHAITKALNMKHDDRKNVAHLNRRREGPIVNKGRGTQPMVYTDVLVNWWNNLAVMQQELANQRQGAKLSAEAQHPYGRGGAAAPEIGGGMRRRRAQHPKPDQS